MCCNVCVAMCVAMCVAVCVLMQRDEQEEVERGTAVSSDLCYGTFVLCCVCCHVCVAMYVLRCVLWYVVWIVCVVMYL